MRAAPRVGVLVQRRAVEAGERPLVAREVRRHPVEDHADPLPVQRVDERAEVVGRAEARRRREEARHLVAPRAAERVLHHRHQLDVREAEVADVAAEVLGELGVAEALRATSRGAPRRSRSAGRTAARRARSREPSSSSHSWRGVEDDARRSAAAPRSRTRPGRRGAGSSRPGGGARTCSARPPRQPGTNSSQIPVEPSVRIGWSAPVPAVEVADDADRARVRRPHGEGGAGDAVDLADVRAELLVQLLVPALARRGGGRARRASAGTRTGRRARP